MRHLTALTVGAVVIMATLIIVGWMSNACPSEQVPDATLTVINDTPKWVFVMIGHPEAPAPTTEELLSPNNIPGVEGAPPTNVVTMTLFPDTYMIVFVICTKDSEGEYIIVKVFRVDVTLPPGGREVIIIESGSTEDEVEIRSHE